jgi:hypothetical protein
MKTAKEEVRELLEQLPALLTRRPLTARVRSQYAQQMLTTLRVGE